jgi:hypothetical protein
MKFLKIAATSVALLAAPTAYAATLDVPVADNAYITKGGLDWAWASPLGTNSIDLSYQGQFGWRLPTLEEFNLAMITAMDFVFDGANVPQGGTGPDGNRFQAGAPGGDAACAAAYFSVNYTHCDWSDGLSGNWAVSSNSSVPETLVVRDVSAVPIPAGFPLVLTGIAAFGWMRRKSRTA